MTKLAEAATTFDVQKIREDFPILRELIHGKPLVYLDNANTTQKPRQVLDALETYYRHDNANIHRATHLLSERATRAYEATRSTVERFINAADSREVVFTKGCTEGINLVAQSWGGTNLKPGDEVLVTWMEHHSNIVPWQLVCAATGATLRVAPITARGELDLEAFDRLLTRAHQDGRDHPREQRAGHDQPRGCAGGKSAGCRRHRAHRRRAGHPAHASRRAGDRLRLLYLFRPQDVWPDRDWRALWPRVHARRDAPLPGRRRHDRVGDVRKDRLQRAPLQVRGRDAKHRGGRGARRSNRLSRGTRSRSRLGARGRAAVLRDRSRP